MGFYKSLFLKMYSLSPSSLKEFFLNRIIRMEGGQMYSKTLREVFWEKYKIKVGYGSYGGCFSPLNVPPGVTFGNYCSIAKEIRIFRANHPKDVFTSHPLLYNPVAGFVKEDQLERPPLEIGHDVWIGEWAVVLPSVKAIGNGAIIGAGSIVTKDVPAYTIVAGNPAKKIGERFSPDVIRELEKSKWWEMDKHNLIRNIDNLNQVVGYNLIQR